MGASKEKRISGIFKAASRTQSGMSMERDQSCGCLEVEKRALDVFSRMDEKSP